MINELIDYYHNYHHLVDLHRIILSVIILCTLILFITEYRSLEVSALISMSLITLTFMVFPYKVNGETFDPTLFFEGFANRSLIAIISLIIMGQGLIKTGALNKLTSVIIKLTKNKTSIALNLVLLISFFTSGFMNNVPVVVIFIPVIVSISKKINTDYSQYLIPLAFISTLGGTLTLIGSGTNILVNSSLINLGYPKLSFFEFTIDGLIISFLGILYLKFIAPLLLKGRKKNKVLQKTQLFTVQVNIWSNSRMIGKTITDEYFSYFKNTRFKLIQTVDGKYYIGSNKNKEFDLDNYKLQEGDIIQIISDTQTLTKILTTKSFLNTFHEYIKKIGYQPQYKGATPNIVNLIEAIIPPGSSFIKQTKEYINNNLPDGCILLGRNIKKKNVDIDKEKIKTGQYVLLMGYHDSLKKLNTNRDLLYLNQTISKIPNVKLSWLAILIFLTVILSTSLGLCNITESSFVGAVLMVAFKCLPIESALKKIDFRIILLIASSITMASAMNITNMDKLIADKIIQLLHINSPLFLLSFLFLTLTIFTNILTNHACAILFTPIAIKLALDLNMDPKVFAIAVIFASSTSFASPIAHPTNLLVLRVGGYSFKDYFKVGVPLILIVWLTFTLLAYFYYNIPL